MWFSFFFRVSDGTAPTSDRAALTRFFRPTCWPHEVFEKMCVPNGQADEIWAQRPIWDPFLDKQLSVSGAVFGWAGMAGEIRLVSFNAWPANWTLLVICLRTIMSWPGLDKRDSCSPQ